MERTKTLIADDFGLIEIQNVIKSSETLNLCILTSSVVKTKHSP